MNKIMNKIRNKTGLTEMDWTRLRFLAMNDKNHFKNILFKPFLMESDGLVLEDADEGITDILNRLNGYPGIRDLFEIHLMTQCLLAADRFSKACIERIGNFPFVKKHHPEFLDIISLCAPARAVPVLVTSESQCEIRYFVIYPMPGNSKTITWPVWADDLMAPETRQSIRDAVLAAHSVSMASSGTTYPVCRCYPLTIPNGTVQFTGRSLGLPVGLGFITTVTGKPWHPDIITSGSISLNGAIEKIGGFEKKCARAGQEYKAFICPSDNAAINGQDNLTVLPVSSLQQARMFMSLYERDTAGQLHLLSAMLEDPQKFIANLTSVPHEWLKWVFEHQQAALVVKTIISSPLLFASLTDCLGACVYHSQSDLAEIVSSLIMPERLADLKETSPLAAFRWCSLCLSLANHRGRVSDARQWTARAADLLDSAYKSSLEIVADYFNHYFISCHNRYCFDPDLPADLQRILHVYEKQYAIQCEFGCPTHMVLGRLYGSITQNYAFCGPRYLNETRLFSKKSRQALGENTTPKFEPEWLRQYNYLTYALLDAGKDHHIEAKHMLLTYLKAASWEGAEIKFSAFTQWEHALTARFLADVKPTEAASYYRHCMDHLCHPPEIAHPWQLWCFNMGRIARFSGETKQAGEWFQKSLSLCLSDHFGAAVRVMAMLPLAALLELDNLKEANLHDVRQRIWDVSSKLETDCFKTLAEKSFEDVLHDVREYPKQWFPFNFR